MLQSGRIHGMIRCHQFIADLRIRQIFMENFITVICFLDAQFFQNFLHRFFRQHFFGQNFLSRDFFRLSYFCQIIFFRKV